MFEFLKDIKELEDVESVEKINKGYSKDEKFKIKLKNGAKIAFYSICHNLARKFFQSLSY